MTFCHALVTCVLATGLCASMHDSAHAHGANPLPKEVFVFEDDSWVLLTNFGVMTSEQPTRYVCEEIFLGGMNYAVLPFDTETWITLSADQVARTTNGGCSFEQLRERDVEVASTAQSRDRSLVAWLTNGTPGTLTWSDDRGETLQDIMLEGLGDVRWTGVNLLSETTLHLSGYSEEEDSRGQARMFTIDLMAPGSLTEIPGWEQVRYPYIFDAHAGEIAGIANVAGELSLLWDRPDVAHTSSTPLEVWPVTMRLSPSGTRLAMAGATTPGSSLIFEREAGGGVQSTPAFAEDASACIAWAGEQDVMFCSRSAGQDFALGKGNLEEMGERETLVALTGLEGPRQGCEADSALEKSCSLVWPELARALRIDLPDDPEPDEDMGVITPLPDMTSSPMDETDMGMVEREDMTPPLDSSQGSDESTCAQAHSIGATKSQPCDLTKISLFIIILGGFIRQRKRG